MLAFEEKVRQLQWYLFPTLWLALNWDFDLVHRLLLSSNKSEEGKIGDIFFDKKEEKDY